MLTSNPSAAPGLQKGVTMKALGVLILAVVALSGCGVGADDPEGQAAAGQVPATATAGQALVVGTPEWSQGRGSSTDLKTDPAALPFDPVPVTNLRPVTGVVR
jgi:hypothetical protein